MATFGLEDQIVDEGIYARTVQRFRDAQIRLPTFAELADPTSISNATTAAVSRVDPDAASALNLFRVHWYNDANRTRVAAVPDHVVLPGSLTGVDAPIVV